MKKIKLKLIVGFLLTTTSLLFAAKSRAVSMTVNVQEIAKQWLVYSQSAPFVLPEQLKNKFKIVAHYKNLTILRETTESTTAPNRELSEIVGVIAVQRDYPVYFAKKKKQNRRPAEIHGSPLPNKPANSPQADCSLESPCKSGNAKYWAYDAIDADLMHFKLQAMGVGENATARVAVVDSGFDKAQAGNMEVIGEIVTKTAAEFEDKHPITGTKLPGLAKTFFLGDPNKDEAGHGTMVSSVIAGKGKLGVAKNVSLAVYRVTAPGNTGSTSSAILETAIYRACEENSDPDGVTVINVSWGGRLDEAGFQPEERESVTQKLMEHFSKKGCLVVKAAGNDNFRLKREMDLKDSYLRVAAIDPSRELSYFSSQGEISAPGSSMYVLESTTTYPKASSDQRCEKADEGTVSPKRMVNGTSFAAPMAAAVASQIVRVLKTKPAFKALTPAERIQLVNSILKASENQNSINGLRAVTISQRWMDLSKEDQSQVFKKDGLSYLQNLLIEKPDPICESVARPCKDETHCEYIIGCVNLARAKIILCDSPKEKFLAEDLALTGFQQKAFHFGYRYANLAVTQTDDLKKKEQLRRLSIESFLDRQSIPKEFKVDAKFWKFPPSIDPNFIRMVIAPYLATEAEAKPPAISKPDTLSENLLRLTLYSEKVHNSLEYGRDPKNGEDRGSEETVKTMQSVLKSSKILLGESKYENILKEFTSNFNSKLAKQYRPRKDAEFLENIFPESLSVSAVRILNTAYELEPDASPLKKSIHSLESDLVSKMRELNQFYGRKTERNPTLSEVYPSRSTLDPLLARHTDKLVTAINQKEVLTLSPVEVQYALEHLNELPITDKAEFLLDVLDCVARDFGWGDKNNRDITGAAMLKLHQIVPKLDEKSLRKTENIFVRTLDEASNMYFVGQLLTSWDMDYPYEKNPTDLLFKYDDATEDIKNGLTYKKHPLLTEENLALLKLKTAAFITKMTPQEAKAIKNEWIVTRAMKYAFEGVWSEKLSRETSFVVPRAPSERTSRLEPLQIDAERMNVKDRGVLFGDFLEAVSKGSSSSENSRFYWEILTNNIPYDIYLRHDERAQKVFRTIKKNSTWVERVKKLTHKGDALFDNSIQRFFDILSQY